MPNTVFDEIADFSITIHDLWLDPLEQLNNAIVDSGSMNLDITTSAIIGDAN
jgi:hypothetical protein